MTVVQEKVKFTVFAEDSDLHGVRQVTRSENGIVRRIVWGLLLAISVGVLVNNTVQQVLNFLSYDHITKYDITFVHTLDFPAITICNVNKHRRTAMTDWDIAVMGPHLGMTDENVTLLHHGLYDQQWYTDTFIGKDFQAVLNSHAGEEYDIADFYNRTAHRFEDMVQHCQWKSSLCENKSWEEDYTHYSKCYTFNKNSDHTLLKAGAGNGLQLVLYDEEDEYIETHNSEDLGFKFLAHDPIEPPFLKEMGFGLAPGFHYLIALKQREIVGLGLPYTECEEDAPTDYYANFSVPACRIGCETDMIFAECNCKLVESPGDHPVCGVEGFDCAEAVLLRIEESDECLCQNPCHAIQYPYTMSMLELREATIDKLRADHPIPDHLGVHQLVVLNIYFDSLAYELIEQVPAYTWLDILSDFGGTMGLWLGASVLAAFQLIDYTIKICSVGCTSRKGRVNGAEMTPVKPVENTGMDNNGFNSKDAMA